MKNTDRDNKKTRSKTIETHTINKTIETLNYSATTKNYQ